MKKSITFLALSILILAIGISLSTAGFYIPSTETSNTVVNFHFPNGNLTTREGEHYNIGGVYSTYYSWGDVIRVFDYSPHRINQYDYPIDLYVIFITVEHNTTLHTVHLLSLHESSKHFFISTYDGEINVYLASPLSLIELGEKGYYRDWEVIFTVHHYGHGNLAFLTSGIVVTFVGILLMTISLRKSLKT